MLSVNVNVPTVPFNASDWIRIRIRIRIPWSGQLQPCREPRQRLPVVLSGSCGMCGRCRRYCQWLPQEREHVVNTDIGARHIDDQEQTVVSIAPPQSTFFG